METRTRHVDLPSIACSTNSPTQVSNFSWSIVPSSSKKALYSRLSAVRPRANKDLPPLVDRTYVSESEYDGGFDRLTGSVVDERVIRSVTICAEGVGDHQRWSREEYKGSVLV